MSLEDLGFQYRGRVYRGHNPYWSFAPESGEGAARNGGRWNSVGQPALYTSERFETAWLESQQGFAFKTQPLTLCTYEVDCGPILDLCDPRIREQIAPNTAEWLSEAWLEKKQKGLPVQSWAIAQQLLEHGFAGIRVSSSAFGATGRDVNMVFWRWDRSPPRQVRAIDDFGRLPKAPDSAGP